MLVLPIEEAEPGIRLAASVWHPEHPEQELLKAGFVLDDTVLRRLRQLNIPAIYVDYPDLSDLDKHLVPALSPERQKIYQQVKRTIAAVEKTAKPSVTYPDYYVATRQLVLTLMNQGQQGIYMEQLATRLPGDEVAHCTAVAHLSLMLGIRLEQYLIRQRSRLSAQHAREVVNLGVAGMLHDIGKIRLSPAARRAHSGNAASSDAAVQEEYQGHSQAGYELVRGGLESSAAVAILQHHQHYDGTGFPCVTLRERKNQPMQGEEIHVFARIVGLANRFDRLAIDPETRRRRENVEVLQRLTESHAAQFDPMVLKILPLVVPPFPPGSKVQLTDGTSAVVVEIDAADPYLPVVRRLVRDNAGRLAIDATPLRLAEAGEVAIQSINGVTVPAADTALAA